MSYSLNHNCDNCMKKDKCTDRHFIEGAISGIHSVWPSDKGHLGAGNIVLNCGNRVTPVDEKSEENKI